MAQLVENLPAMQRPWFDPCIRKIPWRRDRLPTPVFLGFPGVSDGKESACNVGNLGLIPGLGRSPGKGKGNPLLDSGLENSMDYIVHGFAKSRARLSDFPWGVSVSQVRKFPAQLMSKGWRGREGDLRWRAFLSFFFGHTSVVTRDQPWAPCIESMKS